MAANGQRILREWNNINMIQIEETLEAMIHAMNYAPGLEDLTQESFAELRDAMVKFKGSFTELSEALDNTHLREWERDRKWKVFKLAPQGDALQTDGPDHMDVTGRDAADAAERFIAFMDKGGLVLYRIIIHDKSGVVHHYDTIGNKAEITGEEQRYLMVEVQNG